MNHCKILHPSKTYLPAVQIQIPWNCCKILHPSKIYLFKAPSLNVIKYHHSHKFVAGERQFSKRWPAKPELSGKRNGPEVDGRSHKELSGRRQCVQNVAGEGQRFRFA
jgi:hypothetical protein